MRIWRGVSSRLVVVTADVFQLTYCPVAQRWHPQDYLLGVLETPIEVRERQVCSGGQCVRVGDCVRIEMSKPSVPPCADGCDDRLKPDNYLLAFRYRLPDFLPIATLEGASLLLRPFQHLGHRHRIPCGVVEPLDSHLCKFQAAINRHTEESRRSLEEQRVRVQQTPRGIEVGSSNQYLLFQSIKNLL